MQHFWEVRRDSNAKTDPQGSYPQGPISWGSGPGPPLNLAKLLTANGKAV
ncbi:hypothetical protein BN2475_340053 [Paraburkholderia ribeironis]|uniref:Uncharacterized protein n=1 Tax=Paraburkholderia ribeironis TaxID=1247936 RepID=A0A1N7S3V8_9BURK|nr:hypothetical protein BN2475_340053 [Paraburkholderia ribeironis]